MSSSNLLPDLHTDFSRGRSGDMVFPSLSEFSTVYCDPHSQSFGIVNKAETDVCLELSCFFHDPADLAIWSLVPLPFLKPAWTSESSRFMYCWSLAWRILSITLVAYEMSAIVWFEHFLALPFFGIGMKIDLFQSCGHCWVFQTSWHILSFPNFLAYWVQHFHSIIFQDLKQLNWNSITSTSFVPSDAF